MQITEERRDDVVVLSLKGKMMGGAETQAVHDKIKQLVDEKLLKVVIDLAKIKWMNSSGLGVVIGSMTTLKNAGGELKLSNVTEKVQSLFIITRLITIFDTYDSLDSAVESFS